MIVKAFTVKNRLGIHARPAAKFAQTAGRFQSDVYVKKDDLEVNGKSIMGIMMLAAAHGNVIEVRVDGEDEQEALAALEGLIESGFDEE